MYQSIQNNDSYQKIIPGTKVTAHFALLMAQMAFAGWYVVGSLTMSDGANPYVFVLYREVIASHLMYCYAKYCGMTIRVEKEDRIRFLLLGFASFVNVVGAMLALVYMSANRLAIYQPSVPVFGTLISIIVGLEPATLLKGFAIALASAGAVIVVAWKTTSDPADEESTRNEIIGTIIVFAQMIGMACLLVFQKPILHKYHPSVTTVIYYSLGTVYTAILCIAQSYSFTPSALVFNNSLLPWLALAYAASFATLYPYNAYSWAGQYVSPSTSTLYATFQPVGTIILSLLILGTALTVSEGVGAILVIAGLVINVWTHRPENEDHTSDDGSTHEENDQCADASITEGIAMDGKVKNSSKKVKSGFTTLPTKDPESATSESIHGTVTSPLQ